MNQGSGHPGHASRAWRALAGYAVVTFAWTWTIWWGAVVARALSIDVPVGLVVFLGGRRGGGVGAGGPVARTRTLSAWWPS